MPRKDDPPISKEISPGMIYEHCHGRKYQVNSIFHGVLEETDEEVDDVNVFWDATGYETIGKVKRVKKIIFDSPDSQMIVEYTQLEDGSFPAGTKWLRLKDDFEGEVEGVKTFSLVDVK